MRCVAAVGCSVLLLLLLAVPAHADLLAAAEAGDAAKVRAALDGGADPNALPEETWGALHIATLKGHEAVVKLLLARGADPNREQFGSHPLHLALDRGHVGIARLLIAADADLEQPNAAGLRPMHIVTEKDQRDLVELLLEKKANLEGVDRYGRTPLALAADGGNRALVELFLDRGAMPDARLADGRRPLHLSIYQGHDEIAALLLARGARHDVLTAAGTGDVATLAQLIERGDPVDLRMAWSGTTPLMWAARAAKPEAVKLLLAKGAAHSAATKFEFRPMHYAALGGDPACAEALLEAGALVDPKDRRGTTPLHEAAKAGHVEMIAFLAAQGAHVNARHMQEGWTALYTAAFSRHTDAVRALLIAKADITAQTSTGQTALHAGLPVVEITRVLLDAGAKPDAVNKRKRTPLHEAAQEAHAPSALLLIERGADVRAVDDRGHTPLHAVALKSFVGSLLDEAPEDEPGSAEAAARQAGRIAIAEALLAKGVDPRAKDRVGRMPYDLARANGHEALATLLGKAAGEIDAGR